MNNLKLKNPYSFKKAPFKWISYQFQIRILKKERAKYGFSIHDTFELSTWFYYIIPEMVKIIKENKYGLPGFDFIEKYFEEHNELPISFEEYCNNVDFDDAIIKKINDDLLKAQDQLLDSIIYTFNESMEETCSLKNEYEKEYFKADKSFTKEYGFLGEKVTKKNEDGSRPVIIMGSIDKYKDIYEKYNNREKEIEKYCDDNKKKALELFVKNIDLLWW